MSKSNSFVLARYTIQTVDPYGMEITSDGMWVMFEDVQALLETELRRVCKAVQHLDFGRFSETEIVECVRNFGNPRLI